MKHASPDPGFARRALAIFLSNAMLWGTAPIAWAGPEGEQVVHGDVSFSRQGDLTQIHAGDGSIINYSSFDILPQETVQFIQPDESLERPEPDPGCGAHAHRRNPAGERPRLLREPGRRLLRRQRRGRRRRTLRRRGLDQQRRLPRQARSLQRSPGARGEPRLDRGRHRRSGRPRGREPRPDHLARRPDRPGRRRRGRARPAGRARARAARRERRGRCGVGSARGRERGKPRRRGRRRHARRRRSLFARDPADRDRIDHGARRGDRGR